MDLGSGRLHSSFGSLRVLGEDLLELEPGDDVRVGSVAVLVAAILDAAGA